MKRQKSFNNRGKKIHASAHKIFFVEFHLDSSAARERNARVRMYASKVPFTADAHDSGDLFLQVSGIRKVIEAEEFMESLFALLNDGEVVQCQMGNQSPQRTSPHGGPERGCGFAQSHSAFDRSDALDFKVATFVP
jgi:hypothetical protein